METSKASVTLVLVRSMVKVTGSPASPVVTSADLDVLMTGSMIVTLGAETEAMLPPVQESCAWLLSCVPLWLVGMFNTTAE